MYTHKLQFYYILVGCKGVKIPGHEETFCDEDLSTYVMFVISHRKRRRIFEPQHEKTNNVDFDQV